jgi:hypothetical protein
MSGAFDRLLRIRLGVALVGAAVWFTSVRLDDERGRLVGIVLLAFSLLLRFVPRRFHGPDDDMS